MVLLNKTDLVKEDEINKIKAAVKVLNPKANVATTLYSRVELKSVMQTGMFKMEDAVQSAGWLQSMKEELRERNMALGALYIKPGKGIDLVFM